MIFAKQQASMSNGAMSQSNMSSSTQPSTSVGIHSPKSSGNAVSMPSHSIRSIIASPTKSVSPPFVGVINHVSSGSTSSSPGSVESMTPTNVSCRTDQVESPQRPSPFGSPNSAFHVPMGERKVSSGSLNSPSPHHPSMADSLSQSLANSYVSLMNYENSNAARRSKLINRNSKNEKMFKEERETTKYVYQPPVLPFQQFGNSLCEGNFSHFPSPGTPGHDFLLSQHHSGAKNPYGLPQDPSLASVIAAANGQLSSYGAQAGQMQPANGHMTMSPGGGGGGGGGGGPMRNHRQSNALDASRHPKCSKCRNHGMSVAVKSKLLESIRMLVQFTNHQTTKQNKFLILIG